MRVVSHNTNRMKEPSNMTPGMSSRLEARTRMTMRKRIVRPAVTIAKVNNLPKLAGHPHELVKRNVPWYANS